MINVMIVDDEYLVRERLKHGLDWDALGCTVAAEADNGEDALHLLAEHEIHLAIVDINMPILDGLAFAGMARSAYPLLKIIILTGYGTFEYAQSALKAGANDYMLKPVDTDELRAAVAALSDDIRREADRQQVNASMRKKLLESHDILRGRFMRKLLLDGSITLEDDQMRLYCPNLASTASTFVVLSVRSDLNSGSSDESPTDAYTIFGECFASVPGTETWIDEEGLFVIADMGASFSEDRMDKLLQDCRLAMNRIRASGSSTITVGVGRPHAGLPGLQASASEAITSCSYKTLLGTNRIIRCEELPPDKPLPHLASVRESLLIQLRLGSLEGIQATLRELFASLREDGVTLEYLHFLLSELVIVLKLYASEKQAAADSGSLHSFAPDTLVRQLETLDAIEAWMKEKYSIAIGTSESARRSTPAILVEKAKSFIDVNYADSTLDLNRIAASIHVNPSYLSRIFTKETGSSVVTYLTKYRMIKAKELLDGGSQNMTYIAEQTGFTDTQYFSKCFKKQFGLPPSRYIAKL
ncbi:response regulator transcription factor [Paenibacillus spongiae]|uniref:Response regulator n=1 Tax=Paenibacillus spongiae TaxID=2909671 RepID=A0ABY5SDD2_9BACL|nr:response regulator [Paenibacillus spongiae]UVI31959.1 response regulator [Paenibacillus spongiae]